MIFRGVAVGDQYQTIIKEEAVAFRRALVGPLEEVDLVLEGPQLEGEQRLLGHELGRSGSAGNRQGQQGTGGEEQGAERHGVRIPGFVAGRKTR